ncbi:23S rRNA (uracil(1939)-C(5))-methyltransferase RlmD [Acidihalobacter prosperus]
MTRKYKRGKSLPRIPVDLRIDSLAQDGRGVARLDGKAVFVTGGLPGEYIRAILTRRHRDYDEGQVDDIYEASSLRVEPKCEHFGICGGCRLQHLDADAQVITKQQALLDNLKRIGKIQPEHILPPLTTRVWGYRHKARLGVRYVFKKGRVLIGFRERQGRLLADLNRCEILIPEVGQRLNELSTLIGALSVREKIPQIEVIGGDRSVCLTFRHLEPLNDTDIDKLIEFGRRTGLHIALQSGGPESLRLLWPESQSLFYDQPEFGTRVYFRPGDFIQINPALNKKMVGQALTLLNVQPDDNILELFSGLGNFTLPLLNRGARVTAVEGDAVMTKRAALNAMHNGLERSEHITADLLSPSSDMPWLKRSYDKLLLDPPRSGAREMLPHIGELNPSRIVYVSCDMATFARDAGELVYRYGYQLVSAGVMNMFPHTAHVESMALFVK